MKLNKSGYDEDKDCYSSETLYANHPNQTIGAFVTPVGVLNYLNRKRINFSVIHLEDKFALTYACVKSGVLRLEQIWVLSRDQRVRRRYMHMERLERILKSKNLHDLETYDVRQRYCHPVEIEIEPVKIIADFWDRVYKSHMKSA